MDRDTITVPRPGPGEMILAAVDERGAIAWVMARKDTEADLLAQLVPFLAEGQQILHEQAAAGGRTP